MIIFPAIDIKEGKVVRLLQGRFNEVTEYATDPVSIAKQWVARGAQWLHVVDLDGAKEGRMKNFDMIKNIAQSVEVPIQMGGGIRSEDDIKRLFDVRISRVIVSTKAIEDRDFLRNAIYQWPDKIAVSLDCSRGMVTHCGWTSMTNLRATDFAKELESLGLRCLIYTDIIKDGMLTGPNFESLEEILNAVQIPVIASGGISNIEDIKKLCELEFNGLVGAITGKAIYEGTLDLSEAIRLCSQKG